MPLARLDHETRDGVPVIAVSGQLDTSNALDLRDAVLSHITNAAFGLVIDLSGATYLDSAGINVCFELAELLSSRQQQLAIVVPAEARVRRMLELVGLDRAVPVHDSCDSAVSRIVELAGESGRA
jgi:anti-anti-sigma factor